MKVWILIPPDSSQSGLKLMKFIHNYITDVVLVGAFLQLHSVSHVTSKLDKETRVEMRVIKVVLTAVSPAVLTLNVAMLSKVLEAEDSVLSHLLSILC